VAHAAVLGSASPCCSRRIGGESIFGAGQSYSNWRKSSTIAC